MIAADDRSDAVTVEQAVRRLATAFPTSTTAMLDARLLAMTALGVDEAGLIVEGPRPLSSEEGARLDAMAARRAAGEPIAQILGRKEFYGLTFAMRPGVLTPRPDSETLIDAAREARPPEAPIRLLELGVGSGCLVISLLKHFPFAVGVGVDLNPVAIEATRTNARAHSVEDRLSLLIGDWFAPVSATFDLIISNPPYISERDRASLPTEVKDYEDPGALFAGEEGLDAYRVILQAAPSHLSRTGLMILELGAGQADRVMALAQASFPDAHCATRADLAGVPRALIIERGAG